MSKVVERMVSEQMVEYLQVGGMMPRLQSAYRRHHSTETALLRILSDILSAMDDRRVTLLGLLDLSAAFDTVDHSILLRRLQGQFGFDAWNRIAVDQIVLVRSDSAGSIPEYPIGYGSSDLLGASRLGPRSVAFPAVHGRIVQHHWRSRSESALVRGRFRNLPQRACHGGILPAVDRLVQCMESVEQWMGSNRLRLNVDKTQLIWIGTRQQLSKIIIKETLLQSATVPFSSAVTNLGVTIDSELRMADHIANLCKSSYFQLRQLRQIRRSLTTDAWKTLVHAFISSRLDYCNSLLFGIGEGRGVYPPLKLKKMWLRFPPPQLSSLVMQIEV